ncbi:MAG: membrane protein insertase YidC [Steroidobacteraceae bacterium]
MSDNPRIFLWIGLLLLFWLNWQTWQRDYPAGAQPAAPAVTAATTNNPERGTTASGLDAVIPQAPAPAPAATGNAPTSTATAGAALIADQGATSVAGAAGQANGTAVRVVTDTLDLDISLMGGELQRVDLLRYPQVKGGATPVRLYNRDDPSSVYVLQTGLAGVAGAARPTHQATFTAPATEFRLQPGANELRVPLTWTDGQGVTVTKTFILERGGYAVRLEQRVDNRSPAPWAAAPYAQILRHNVPIARSMFSVESYAFKGPAYDDGKKYQKLKLDSAEDSKLSRDIQGGWLAALQHHFVSAVVPPPQQTWHYALNVRGVEYLFAAVGPSATVEPGASATFSNAFYVGPKLQKQLATVSPRLYLVTDYGILAILAKPLFWLLSWLHALFGNWGWAILVATAILKVLFYPLSEASGKSMAKMRALQPRIKNLQETYKDDREKLGRAMMELYQREKINPVAGCLPMIIQMPVFLAFYWVLLESVEMRQAPFMGWISDLSARDPYFILPLLMAGAMFVQYKLNPTPPDPVQQKVFMIMPLAMSAMFAFFPSGLVLYWVTNTVLSIAQQWNINRRIDAAGSRK